MGAMVGRTGAPDPDARTRCRCAPPWRKQQVPFAAATLAPMPLVPARFRLLAVVVGILIALAGCSSADAPSFNPTGPCTTDGNVAGAYPDLEARIPTTYRDVAPETLDSGRNCSADKLGSLADAGFEEVRFAGATWTFGAERALAMVVFSAPGLQAEQIADLYASSARSANRTEILAETDLSVAGRPARRIDTKTGERLQTVVSWPAAEAD